MKKVFLLYVLTIAFFPILLQAQTLTGVWRGKVKGTQAELKLVKSGDQIVGVAYYYQNKNRYKRYSIKGHFDPNTNSVIWWDELLLEDQGKRGFFKLGPDPDAQLSVADFNCPGADEMYLDGTSSARDNKEKINGTIHLEKKEKPIFRDEWDFIIENYLVGANDPTLIDSISTIGITATIPEEKELPLALIPSPAPGAPVVTMPVVTAPATKPNPSGITDKFNNRKNVLQTVIPITAKTIELRFYDNAQIDGDSIALFLNGRLLFQNIRLTDQPYTVKLDASELGADNELVMVAENLGSIPPNTSLMVAIVGDKRYEARLFANEQSSALVRIMRPKPGE
ncbi:hypothetical protein KJS94_17205 [Flavihumibacter rivuli]|uniref:hypothetical protein n=1 Tax=Flavihumibacter rivuli TaxID=2838156 RepID=UPI001BDEA854|nr:hypothetical protein [Flavihumibacter rivuli]ULQ56391.1 hypothetical protein KJS94_17205 [Flavihumibacter rivuli]